MSRALGVMFAAAVASLGCGDNFEPPGLTPDQLFAKLRRLPGVTVEERPTEQPGFHYYVLHVTQPVDHNDHSLGMFRQEVSLLHRDERASVPLIIHTSGYADFARDQPVELTKLLAANQVSIEHRFFGSSRPEPADWTKLTIEQMAADEHAIIEALRTIYQGAFITTGGSKGGMTAVFHRRFYPDDVDGTVAYVAPISFGAPDTRYPAFLDKIGNVVCREKVRHAAVRMLSARREAMCSQAEGQLQHKYTRILVGPAVEAAIVSLEWTFWQYSGIKRCDDVPGPTATDDQLFAFLDEVSPVSDSDDDRIAAFEAYYYQAESQLGYPDAGAAYLAPYLWYSDEEYLGELPVPEEPEYDSESMRDIDDFVEHRGERLLFIYGEWDPWTRGQFLLGDAVDSKVLYQNEGNHMARIAGLDMFDQEVAFAKLHAWTGVQPMLSRLHPKVPQAAGETAQAWQPTTVERAEAKATRMPPALVRALRARTGPRHALARALAEPK